MAGAERGSDGNVARSNRSALWRLPVDTEVSEELELHLEMRAREFEERGMSPEEARREALRRFGDPRRHAEDCRREAKQRNRRWQLGQWLDEARQDLRFAGRQIRRRPLLAVLLVGMLAVGIGATTATASLLYRALWQPLPFADPDQLVAIWEENTVRGKGTNVAAPPNFLAFRDETTSFESMAAFITTSNNLGVAGVDGGEPRRVKTRLVTEGYFDVLGVEPIRGRDLEPGDAVDGAADVVLVSHRLWRESFGAREDLVGTTIDVNGTPYEVVGIMPPEAGLDIGPAVRPYGDAADLWVPLPISEGWRTARGRWLMIVARLADGAEIERARTEIETVMVRQAERLPDLVTGWTAAPVPLAAHLREPVRLPLQALAGAVGLVLLIVCVNASSLLLSRNLGRGDEMAVRRALGAGRGRLGRQLLAEGAVLAAAAAGLGWLLALGLRRLAASTLPGDLAAAAQGPLPQGLLWLTVAATGLTVLVFGWLPSMPRLGRLAALAHLGAVGGDRGKHRLRAVLVFVQTALALVLLVGAALMLRTVDRLLDVDPGFDRDGVVGFSVALPRGGTPADVFSFYDRLMERLGALPGVASVGAVTHVPMSGVGAATSYFPTDRSAPEPGQAPVADIRVVRGDYFDTLGIGLVAGRAFDGSERPDADPGSVIVSRSLAEAQWPGESALGRQVEIAWGDADAREIVGVVDDVHLLGLGTEPRDTIYFPHDQEIESSLGLVVRADRDLASLAPDIRAVVAELDSTLPIFALATLQDVVGRTLAEQRFLARILAAFALLAFLLAVVGIYGVTSLTITESTREIGLRIALGSSPWGVVGLFVRRVALWTLGALTVGLAVAVLAGRAVESLLFEVTATDPVILVGAAVLVALAALVAALVPARRAARIDPSLALRWD